MNFSHLPKIELHLHLDCSLSYEVVKHLDPAVTREEYEHSFKAGEHCHSLQDYLTRAVKGFQLMQDKESLRLVTLDLFDQLKADNVIYAEIRFAPYLHLEKGLTPEEVVQTVDEAMHEGMAQSGVEAGLILCTLRHYDELASMHTAELVKAYQHSSVVGFDIAADEAGYPIDAHIQAFQWARHQGLHITAHAGEACGPESVWETLEHFKPARIGHGVRSAEDPKLIAHLKKQNIHLEICPTSNLQTGMYDRLSDHPVNSLYRQGVHMSINTDGRTISDVTLEEEYRKLAVTFDWEKEKLLRCNLMATEAAFISDEKKESLKNKLIAGWTTG